MELQRIRLQCDQPSHHMSRELRGVIDQDGVSAQGVCIVASTREPCFLVRFEHPNTWGSCRACLPQMPRTQDRFLGKFWLAISLESRILTIRQVSSHTPPLGSSRIPTSQQVSNLIHPCSSINHFKPQCPFLHIDPRNLICIFQIQVCLKIGSPRWISHEISMKHPCCGWYSTMVKSLGASL